MVSLAGEIPARDGVGEGKGFCTLATVNARPAADLSTPFDEAPASAKVFNESPAIHASAHVLTAANLRGLLIIISLLRDRIELPPRARSKCRNTNTQSARRT